ncbi:MAG: helix-turn-helix domain-containing protein, partial [Pseudorhodobacter sp.]|nr:helix-turn-helix domain-containing protein [Pseudorhodobacter sp.]
MRIDPSADFALPAWLPPAVRLYLDHTEEGLSLRAIARRDGSHASTVLRQVRRYEVRRDDPLLDEALQSLSRDAFARATTNQTTTDLEGNTPMSAPIRHQTLAIDEATILREGKRILRRLAEPGAVLAIASDMEKAAVMRVFPDGRSARTGVVDRAVAQAFALKDWITCRKSGRVASYDLSATGRSALKRMLEEEEAGRVGMAEAAMPFAAQHGDWGAKEVGEEGARTRVRYNLAESPAGVLGRRGDKDG